MKPLSCIILTFCLLTACSISMTPEYHTEVRRHRSVAILPFEVNLYEIEDLKNKSPKMLEIRESELGFFFQYQAFKYFNSRKPKNKQVRVAVQEVEETNRKLSELGISNRQIRLLGEKELARFLGVDAFIYGSVDIRKDNEVRNNAQMASYSPFASAMDMQAIIDIKIANSKTSSIIWQYREPNKGYSKCETPNDTILFNNLFAYPLSKLSYKGLE